MRDSTRAIRAQRYLDRRTSDALSPRQRELLAFLVSFWAKQKRSPSRTEIQAALGCKTRGTIERNLSVLERKGHIFRGILPAMFVNQSLVVSRETRLPEAA